MKKSVLKIAIVVGLIIMTGYVSYNIPIQNRTKIVSASGINDKLFELVGYQNLKSITKTGYDEVFILKNKETGKKFILYKGYEKGGLTPLD